MMKKIFTLILALMTPALNISLAQIIPFGMWQKIPLKLNITTSAQTIFARNCSGSFTVQALSQGNVATNATAANIFTLTFTADSPNVTFYSDQTCTLSITSKQIASGTSSSTIYFLSNTTGSSTITVNATSPMDRFFPTTQIQTFTTNPYVWTGLGGNTDWETGGNWSGGSKPGNSDIAVFDDTCASNCSPNITTANISPRGIRLHTGYTGTITQVNKNISLGTIGLAIISGTMTLSSDGTSTFQTSQLAISGGTLTASTNVGNSFTVTSNAYISGGTFTAPAGTLTHSGTGEWNVTGSPTVTFPTGSTYAITSVGGGLMKSITPGNVNYQNVSFLGSTSGRLDFSNNTMKIFGTFSVSDGNSSGVTSGLYNGFIHAYGDVNFSGYGKDGSTTIVMKGNASGQTLSGDPTNWTYFPHIQLDTGSNNVTLTGKILLANKTWTVTSCNSLISTGSDLRFSSSSGFVTHVWGGGLDYNNVDILLNSGAISLNATTMNVRGTFSFGDTINGVGFGSMSNGTINAYGPVISTYNGKIGGLQLVIKGNIAGQTLTSDTVGADYWPDLTIDTGSNAVTLVGNFLTNNNITYTTSGTFDATNSSISFVNSGVTMNFTPGSVTWGTFKFQTWKSNLNLGGGTLNIGGDFYFGDTSSTGGVGNLNNGTINCFGNIIQTASTSYRGMGGSAIIVVKGNNSVTKSVTGASSWWPAFTIDSGTNNITMTGGFVFNKNYTVTSTGSSTDISAASMTFSYDNGAQFIAPGNLNYGNVTLSSYRGSFDLSGGTWNILGNFTFEETSVTSWGWLNNGTINAYGSTITAATNGKRGNATIVAKGNAIGQTLISASNGHWPNVVIDAGSSSVTLNGTFNFISTANNQNPSLWTYVSSNGFDATNSTMIWNGSPTWSTLTLSMGSVQYGNVKFHGSIQHYDLGGNTLKVKDFEFGSYYGTTPGALNINNGVIEISGNLSVVNYGNRGSAQLKFVGSSPQTITSNGQPTPAGTMTIASTSTVTLTTAFAISNAGQDLTIQSGTLNMAGFNLSVNDILTINSGATLTQSAGTLTQGTLVNNGTLNP